MHTRVASVNIPLADASAPVGDVHTVPISHGEGRFVAPQRLLDKLIANGQIATQYVDPDGTAHHGHCCATPTAPCWPSRASPARTAGSSARWATRSAAATYLYKNVTGDKYQPIFEGGVDYFKV